MGLTPENGEAHVLSAVIASRAGEIESTEERIRVAEKMEPTSTALFLTRARLLLAKGELEATEEALEAAESAVDENPMSLLMFDLEGLQGQYREMKTS